MLVVTLLFSNLQCNKIISEYDYDVVPIGNVPVDVVNPAVFTFSFILSVLLVLVLQVMIGNLK